MMSRIEEKIEVVMIWDFMLLLAGRWVGSIRFLVGNEAISKDVLERIFHRSILSSILLNRIQNHEMVSEIHKMGSTKR